MRDLLHRIGDEYRKPKFIPGNLDIDAQEIVVSQNEHFMLKKNQKILKCSLLMPFTLSIMLWRPMAGSSEARNGKLKQTAVVSV